MGIADPALGSSSVRYAILGKLATGGMAELFLARASSLGGVERHVVLKRVLPSRLVDPQFATMFLDEARLAAQLHHHNIAQVHDIGRLGESYFFTMEYVHGEDVRAVLARLSALERKLPISHTLHIAAGVAAGLHYAHERTRADGRPLNIVHRDVTPANVMVSYEGAVKLVDFGVAKAAHRSIETQVGAVKGKVAYLSPEQCRGRPVDRRSDVFSMGILLHEMLTGARLFRRISDYDTMQAIVGEEVPPPSRRRPEVTPSLDRIVMTALAKDPRARFQGAGEMLEALEGVAIRDGWTMSPAGVGRFLRELFGERPEPWIELRARDDSPSLITVTSASVRLPRGETHETFAPDDAEVEAQLKKTVPLRAASRDDELPPAPVAAGSDDEQYQTLEDEPDAVATILPGRGPVGRSTGATQISPIRADAAARRSAMGLAPVGEPRRPARTTRPLEPIASRDSDPKLTQHGRAANDAGAPAPTAPPLASGAGKATVQGRAVTLPPPRPSVGASSSPPPPAETQRSSRETGPGIEIPPLPGDSLPALTTPAAPSRNRRPSDVQFQLIHGPAMRAFEDAIAAVEDDGGLDFVDEPPEHQKTTVRRSTQRPVVEVDDVEDAAATAQRPATKEPTARRAESPSIRTSGELAAEGGKASAEVPALPLDDPELEEMLAQSRQRRVRLYAIGVASVAAIAVVVVVLSIARRGGDGKAAPPAAETASNTPAPGPAATGPREPTAAPGVAPAPQPSPTATLHPVEPASTDLPPYIPPEPATLPLAGGTTPDIEPAEDPEAERSDGGGDRGRDTGAGKKKGPAKSLEGAALDHIRTAVAARDWGDALAHCASAPRRALTGQVRGACALAACSARREPEAKKYAGGLPERRKTAIRQSCLSRGVSID